MITFNSIEEIKKYYNKNTNTYEFIEDDTLLDVKFAFDLEINGNIKARDIKAWDIKAQNIRAYDINALDINALDINANVINARNIKAGDITYYAVCFAYRNIECLSIKGLIVNAKHFVLNGEIKIIEKNKRRKEKWNGLKRENWKKRKH